MLSPILLPNGGPNSNKKCAKYFVYILCPLYSAEYLDHIVLYLSIFSIYVYNTLFYEW